jgi:hypothetical protein
MARPYSCETFAAIRALVIDPKVTKKSWKYNTQDAKEHVKEMKSTVVGLKKELTTKNNQI